MAPIGIENNRERKKKDADKEWTGRRIEEVVSGATRCTVSLAEPAGFAEIKGNEKKGKTAEVAESAQTTSTLDRSQTNSAEWQKNYIYESIYEYERTNRKE